ncbi:MAG: hypothetical protein ABI742_06930, partial [Gemmatimonadota bacterium]
LARAKAPQRYGDNLLAAPVAGRRAACAALLRAARGATPARGSVTVAFVVEQSFTRRGLLTIAKTRGPFSDALLLEAVSGDPPANRPASPDPENLPSYESMGLRVRYAGTVVETVSLTDAEALERALRVRIGGGE